MEGGLPVVSMIAHLDTRTSAFLTGKAMLWGSCLHRTQPSLDSAFEGSDGPYVQGSEAGLHVSLSIEDRLVHLL